MMIIDRPMERKGLRSGEWILIYGRRKTGKTFLVENFADYDEFFFVKRDGGIIDKRTWDNLIYDYFTRELRLHLNEGKTVVVDEFHRLGPEFLDLLHAMPKKGSLILLSSTMHTAKTLMESRSPVLGKFSELRVPLINIGDALLALRDRDIPKKEALEMAVIMREPITIPLLEKEGIEGVMEGFSMTIPALIGEVFTEEERRMSRTYEGIISAVASGRSSSGEISSFLHSRRLIPRDDPSIVQQYLNNLVSLGILKKTRVWGKKRLVYSHESPLTEIFYYLDEKYGIKEGASSRGGIEKMVEKVLPGVIEREVRDFLGFLMDMNVYTHLGKDFEVDGILGTFKKAEIALEVKWKKRVRSDDLRRAEENLSRISSKRRVLFVPDKDVLGPTSLELMDVDDLLSLYEKKIEKI